MAEPALPPAPPARRALVPREHGAWGQLAMPLLGGLLLGRPAVAPAALAAAVVLAFLAHEPLLVVLGQRGKRLRDEEGERARRWLALEGAAAAACGALGLWLAPPLARAALGAAAVLGAIVAVLVSRKLEKTAPGELLVIAALSVAGGAVALAGAAAPEVALAATLAWILSFGAATFGVRAVLARLRSKGAEDPGTRQAALAAGCGALAFALAVAGLPAALAWATLPGVVAGVVIALARRATGKALKPVGWSIVAVSVLTLGVLVLGLR
ncbi:MAG: YwiC-like family protein [Anaeromyxobacter sp.]